MLLLGANISNRNTPLLPYQTDSTTFSYGAQAWMLFSGIPWVGTATFVVHIDVQNSFLICSRNSIEQDLDTLERQRRNGCLHTALGLRPGRLVGYSIRQAGQLSLCVQVLSHG